MKPMRIVCFGTALFSRISLSRNMSSSRAATDSSSRVRRIWDHLRRTKDGIFLLDGGTGEELFARGVPDDRKIWSATAVKNEKYHSTLADVHRSFLEAGSDAITTNSYGITPGVGFSEEEIDKYVATAGKIAREVVRKFPGGKLVFGSLGPLIESYRPDKLMEKEDGVRVYKGMARSLAPFVDVFIAETMSCVKESEQVMLGVGQLDETDRRPLIVSYTLDSEGNLRDRDLACKAVREALAIARRNQIDLLGVLFNCAEPEAVTKALMAVRHDASLQQCLLEQGVLMGAYANRLTPVDPNWSLAESDAAQDMRTDLDAKRYSDEFAKKWVDQMGARVVGGCCGISPEYISYLNNHLRKVID